MTTQQTELWRATCYLSTDSVRAMAQMIPSMSMSMSTSMLAVGVASYFTDIPTGAVVDLHELAEAYPESPEPELAAAFRELRCLGYLQRLA